MNTIMSLVGLLVWGLAFPQIGYSQNLPTREQKSLCTSQQSQAPTFYSWRPKNNPSRLIKLGMNKGEALVIAGKPNRDESYYMDFPRKAIRVSNWYYIKSGSSPKTTLLKFAEDTLICIIPSR